MNIVQCRILPGQHFEEPLSHSLTSRIASFVPSAVLLLAMKQKRQQDRIYNSQVEV